MESCGTKNERLRLWRAWTNHTTCEDRIYRVGEQEISDRCQRVT